MGMLERGAAMVADKLKRFASVDVFYQVADVQIALKATRGQTANELSDTEGLTVKSFNRDYLIDAADLAIEDDPIEPERGHVIEDDGQLYEVLPVGGQCWRWSDRGHTRRRIHCRWIGPNPEHD